MALAVLGVCVRHVMGRRYGERAVIMKVQSAEIRLAKTRSVCKHGVKYRGELARRTRYDTQHLGRCRLLLQSLAQITRALAKLVQQPRVLDGDDGLGGEVLDQLNLLFGERPHFLAEDVDDSNQLVVFEHRHADRRADAAELDPSDSCGIAFGISLGRCKVGEMGRLLRSHHLAQRAARGRTEWAAASHFSKRRRYIVRSDNTQSVFLAEIERAEFGFAKPSRVRQHGLKYRLEFARRA